MQKFTPPQYFRVVKIILLLFFSQIIFGQILIKKKVELRNYSKESYSYFSKKRTVKRTLEVVAKFPRLRYPLPSIENPKIYVDITGCVQIEVQDLIVSSKTSETGFIHSTITLDVPSYAAASTRVIFRLAGIPNYPPFNTGGGVDIDIYVDGEKIEEYCKSLGGFPSLIIIGTPVRAPYCLDAPECDEEIEELKVKAVPVYNFMNDCNWNESNMPLEFFTPNVNSISINGESFLCYNANSNHWQLGVQQNTIEIRPTISICENNISKFTVINSLKDLNNRSNSEICKIFNDILKHYTYGNFSKCTYILKEVLDKHEESHLKSFEKLINNYLSNNKFSTTNLKCNDIKTENDRSMLSQLLLNKKINRLKNNVKNFIRKKWLKNLGAYESTIHSSNIVTEVIGKYLDYIENKYKNIDFIENCTGEF